MRFAIFSDLHDNDAGLAAVLADAAQWQVDRFVYLGDVGRDPHLFLALQERGIACTFGNWEVSGWQRLPSSLATWVGDWPALIRRPQAIFCHATPDMPPTVTNTAAATTYMANGLSWRALFPRLHRQEAARWEAFAVLETAGVQVAFHGHTHIQEVWAWTDDGNRQRRLRTFREPIAFLLEQGLPTAPNRYLIGVGSAGAPDDGPFLRYVVYDERTGQVWLRRL
jgi:predicted phosphodiesterase